MKTCIYLGVLEALASGIHAEYFRVSVDIGAGEINRNTSFSFLPLYKVLKLGTDVRASVSTRSLGFSMPFHQVVSILRNFEGSTRYTMRVRVGGHG